MKSTLLAVITATPLLISQVSAGVNGTYRVSGSENDNGERTTFTGTVKVVNYRSGTYNLQYSGDGATSTSRFTFTFSKPLKETTNSQTVVASNKLGTSSATFYKKSGKMHVKFSYKSKDGSVRGQGSGSK